MTATVGGEGGDDLRVDPVVTVRYWAAARSAVGRPEEQYAAPAGLAALRAEVLRRHPDPQVSRVLAVCSVLVDGRQPASPDATLTSGSVVEFLPPFAGG